MGPEATSPNWVASHFPALRQVSLWGSCHSHGAAEGHGTLPSGKTPGCLAGGSFAGQLSLTSAWSKEQSQDGTALVTLSLVTALIVFICIFKNSVLPFLTRNLNHILFEILQRDVAMQLPFYKLLNETISSSQLCLKNKGLENKPVFSRPGRQWARQRRILCRASSQSLLCMARSSVLVWRPLPILQELVNLALLLSWFTPMFLPLLFLLSAIAKPHQCFLLAFLLTF